jgi:hypothetical protein
MIRGGGTRLETIELAGGRMGIIISIEKAAFRILNRYIVVPGFKRGLGRLISNPFTGRIVVRHGAFWLPLEAAGERPRRSRGTPQEMARRNQLKDRFAFYFCEQA